MRSNILEFGNNLWWNIVDWFYDRTERRQLIKSFNISAKRSFISGEVPTLLKAQISKGEKSYKHQFSRIFGGTGFRIVAFSGKQLSKNDLEAIGQVILQDEELARHLVVLGWDTLEVQGDVGKFGCRWQLKDFLMLSNI